MVSEFKIEEKLFRGVKNDNPDLWKNGKPTSAAFKDSKGVSIEKAYTRNCQECIDSMKRYLPIHHFVSNVVALCNELNCFLVYNPISSPMIIEHHALIYKNQNLEPLTNGQAKRLSRNAVVEFVNNQ